MNNKKISAFLLVLVGVIAIPFLVQAADFKAGKQPAFSSDEKSGGNLYIAGGSVTSTGSVLGDLLAAGGSVLVNGPVAGDLMLVGGSITSSGDVAGDLRIGGGNIVVQGNVKGDVVVGGGQINIVSKTIGGDVAIGGGTVRIESAVEGDLKIGGEEVYVNSSITGNVDIKADRITLGPKANIAGDLSYKSSRVIVLEEGAVVVGETKFTQAYQGGASSMGFKGELAAIFTALFILKLLMFLLAALLFGLVFKRYSNEMVKVALNKPLKEFVRGLVTIIVLPVLSVILCVSLIGLPLGILGFTFFVALVIFMAIITPIFLGALVDKYILKKNRDVSWQSIVLGMVASFILSIIPIVGGLALMVAMFVSLGAALNIKVRMMREWM